MVFYMQEKQQNNPRYIKDPSASLQRLAKDELYHISEASPARTSGGGSRRCLDSKSVFGSVQRAAFQNTRKCNLGASQYPGDVYRSMDPGWKQRVRFPSGLGGTGGCCSRRCSTTRRLRSRTCPARGTASSVLEDRVA